MPRLPRILYHCQSLLGVGHLTASLRIIEALLPHAEVDLIHGGLGSTRGFEPEHAQRLRCLKLPTLLHDARGGGLVHAHAPGEAGECNDDALDAVWAARAAATTRFLRWPYDAVVIEFWPFGRRRFKAEIMALLEAARARCGNVPIFTSVRDVLVPRPPEKEQRMVHAVRKHIHTVFVRSDPAVVRLHDTFSLAGEIEHQLCHTGYLAPRLPHAHAGVAGLRGARQAQVLVSQGGGQVGGELLQAALGAAPHLPQLHFKLVAGARATAAELQALRAQARSANVEVLPFMADFVQALARSVLSINMGGDNTLLDMLATRTPSLAYPYQGHVEQAIRIQRFAALGLVHALEPADLAPPRMVARIQQALAAPYPQRVVAMDGARVTSERILAVLDARFSFIAPDRARSARHGGRRA